MERGLEACSADSHTEKLPILEEACAYTEKILFEITHKPYLLTGKLHALKPKLPIILVSSAAYVLSDYLITSEGNTAYNIFKHLANHGYQFHAISAYIRINKPLQNVTLH